ncbi:MAG: aminotransferase class I/II-fold pyridoxal phosphate-dependent enzyme [Sphingomonas sp.]
MRQAVADQLCESTRGSILAAEEVIVTSGATEALAAAIFALVQPGDEVICFPPIYDAYAPLIEARGRRAALRAAGTRRTGGSTRRRWRPP